MSKARRSENRKLLLFVQWYHKCCFSTFRSCLSSLSPTFLLFSLVFLDCLIVMFNFGDELTIQSYRIPWLIWIQLLIMFLIIVFLYCCSIIAFEFSDDSASASPSVGLFTSARSDVDKPLFNSTAGTITSSHHSKVCLFFFPLSFSPFCLNSEKIKSWVFYYVILFFLFSFSLFCLISEKIKEKVIEFSFFHRPFDWFPNLGGMKRLFLNVFILVKNALGDLNHGMSFSSYWNFKACLKTTNYLKRILLVYTFFGNSSIKSYEYDCRGCFLDQRIIWQSKIEPVPNTPLLKVQLSFYLLFYFLPFNTRKPCPPR